MKTLHEKLIDRLIKSDNSIRKKLFKKTVSYFVANEFVEFRGKYEDISFEDVIGMSKDDLPSIIPDAYSFTDKTVKIYEVEVTSGLHIEKIYAYTL